ncbi:MAG: HepT-like ribonuclease domain-containing protein [Anaerolineae bacterium]
MPRDPRLYLDDILEAIGQIQEYTASLDYGMFAQDRKTQDAVVRNLEIIGEAAGRSPCHSEERSDEESRFFASLRMTGQGQAASWLRSPDPRPPRSQPAP